MQGRAPTFTVGGPDNENTEDRTGSQILVTTLIFMVPEDAFSPGSKFSSTSHMSERNNPYTG